MLKGPIVLGRGLEAMNHKPAPGNLVSCKHYQIRVSQGLGLDLWALCTFFLGQFILISPTLISHIYTSDGEELTPGLR